MQIGPIVITTVAVAVAVFWAEPVAQACSGTGCPAPLVLPHDGTSMPVNATGIAWAFGDSPEFAVLVDVEADIEIPIALNLEGPTLGLYPAQALEPDKAYRFDLPASACGSPAFSQTVFTTAAVELATTHLGSLIVAPPLMDSVPVPESISCTTYLDAVLVRVELELDPQIEPFAALLMYETFVDGEPWDHLPHLFSNPNVGQSWAGRGVDVVFATCPGAGPDGLSLGSHEVVLRARIPGLPGVVLETAPVEVVLECESDSETDDDGESGDDGETGGFVPLDDPSGDSAGCGCTATTERSAAVVTVPLLLMVAGVRRRRRRAID